MHASNHSKHGEEMGQAFDQDCKLYYNADTQCPLTSSTQHFGNQHGGGTDISMQYTCPVSVTQRRAYMMSVFASNEILIGL